MRFKLFVAAAFLLAFAFVFASIRPIREESQRVEPSREVFLVSEIEVPQGKDEDYGNGYRNGYYAFMSQDLEERGIRAVNYTALPERTESGGDSYDEGYVDGYHKATNAASCVCGGR